MMNGKAYPVPSFLSDFEHADDLERIANRLIDAKKVTLDWTVDYFWKRKGGQRSGKGIQGKCQKPSGLLKHYSERDFIIWLAADYCRDSEYTADQIEALLFHELQHIGTDEDEETGGTKPVLVAHDFEGFIEEVRQYGAWDVDAKAIAAAFQAPLL